MRVSAKTVIAAPIETVWAVVSDPERALSFMSAMTRWEVAAALSSPDRLGGLGRTAYDLTLSRNRRGRCGRFIVCWDHHERNFVPPALPFALAAPARDRPDDALARTG